MDLSLVILLALALVGGLVLFLAWRTAQSQADMARLAGGSDQLAQSQAQLAGRLAQLAETVDTRLSAVSKQMSEGLSEHGRRTGETLGKIGERLAVIDAAQKNIADLSQQMVGLQDILSNKQARGAFGEVQLENLVTSCLPPSAYQFQATLSGGRRVDCLLKLPMPPGAIAIDSKFPLESYRLLREAKDEAAIAAASRAFAADVKKHVTDIAERYIVPGETAESALMFLPSEAIYAELHANFVNVIEESYRRRVWIVSPTTLMATLNTVRAVLKDARMREQAGVIQNEVRHLLEDTARLDDRVDKLSQHFDQAAKDIRDIRISADKVKKRGERIDSIELGDDALPLAQAPDKPPAPPQGRISGG